MWVRALPNNQVGKQTSVPVNGANPRTSLGSTRGVHTELMRSSKYILIGRVKCRTTVVDEATNQEKKIVQYANAKAGGKTETQRVERE